MYVLFMANEKDASSYEPYHMDKIKTFLYEIIQI